MKVFGKGLFTFLSILIGYNAQKAFGGTGVNGVMLPRFKPFITACLGGALGGFFIGLVAWLGLPVGTNTVFGPSCLVTLPLMTSSQGIFAGMTVYLAGLIVAWIGGFVFTWWGGTRNVGLS